MRRSAIAIGLGFALALAACGGQDQAQETARTGQEAREATEVTVDSAKPAGAPSGHPVAGDTQATVESAKPGDESAEE